MRARSVLTGVPRRSDFLSNPEHGQSMTDAGPPVLELRGVKKHFADVAAVGGVSEVFAPGEYACIVGPSGCGKTTLLRLIAGFETPDAGELLLGGRSLRAVPPEHRDVNVVFQNYALFPHMTVEQNIAFGLRMKRVDRGVAAARVAEALQLVRLDAERARYPAQLSGGQQQRVALARALANQPRVLLLDEPMSALDRELRARVQDELRAVQRATGITFIHVTHDQAEALAMADRLLVMRHGKVEQAGTPREVYEAPANRFVAEFFGSANLLEGNLDADGTVRTGAGLDLRGSTSRPPGPVTVAIRPENVRIHESASQECTPAQVTGVIFGGAFLICELRAGTARLVAHVAPTHADSLKVGEHVRISVDPAAARVLPAAS